MKLSPIVFKSDQSVGYFFPIFFLNYKKTGLFLRTPIEIKPNINVFQHRITKYIV
jgi:hypothetical protein